MHPRNKYKTPPNFEQLAALYPDFAAHYQQCKGTSSTSTSTSTSTTRKRCIDFQDPAALLSLTKTLLFHDFQLVWDMPLNHLCPALTVRLNYLHWIEDLLELANTTTITTTTMEGGLTTTRGLDVGTGASVVYPLLGCRLHTGWQFVATEVDAGSVSIAQKNVKRNNMQDRIQIVHVTDALTVPILQPVRTSTSTNMFSFTMCNPPFFETTKVLPSNTATGKSATASETVTAGGEVAFVIRMVEESVECRDQAIWFTSMLGKKASLKPISKRLHNVDGLTALRTTRLVQGKTSRWAIAWSFQVLNPTTNAVQRTLTIDNVNVSKADNRVAACLATMKHVDSHNLQNGAILVTEQSGAYQVELLLASVPESTGTDVGVFIHVEGNYENYSSFERFIQRLRKDVARTGRSWRRKRQKLPDFSME